MKENELCICSTIVGETCGGHLHTSTIEDVLNKLKRPDWRESLTNGERRIIIEFIEETFYERRTKRSN